MYFLLLVGLLIMFGVFSMVNFKFLSILIVMEKLKILILLFTFMRCSGMSYTPFLIFMVVVTVEVVMSLVALTRLWKPLYLVY